MKLLTLCFTSVFFLYSMSVASTGAGDRDAIMQTIQDAYIQGVFVERSEAAVRSGFHPSFTMAVYADDELIQAPLDVWLERMQLDDVASGDSIKGHFKQIDATDNTATVKLELWINGKRTYTDYFGLYKFSEGWKIVNKIFASHGA